MVAAAYMGASAFALSITPESLLQQWNGAIQLNPLDASQVETVVGLSAGSLTEVYKSNVDGSSGVGSDEKAFAASYDTTFSNTANDPADALIDYISGNSISGAPIYLGVKGGRGTPSWYIFNISSWNGTEDISLTGFWPENNSISHVAIFTGRSTNVPDGGSTLAFIGFAVAGLGFLRRKLS